MRALVLLVWSFAAVAAFHRPAAAPELRYSRVAEGNISDSVQRTLARGVSGYFESLQVDATSWGRVRPVHVLYHSLPFIATMIRNGDLFHDDPEVPLPERMNGDLATHVAFQIVVVSVTLSALAGLIWRVTGVWWAAFLFPLVFAMANRCLAENLLVNFCDSGEIGQLLFVGLYMISLERPLAGRAPQPGAEVAGAGFLALAYGMKETTVVLLPAVLGVLGLRLFPSFRPTPAFKRYVARQALVHIVLAGMLLAALYPHRGGTYVAHNYQIMTDLFESVRRSWVKMRLPKEIVRGSLVGLLACAATWVAQRRANPAAAIAPAGGGPLLLLCVSLAAGFWAINLPWQGQLSKYYLPTSLFAAALAVMVPALVAESLRRQGLKPAALLWVAGSSAYMLWGAPGYQAELSRNYRSEYEHRKTVPAVAADIAASASPATAVLRIHLVAGRIFQDGVLPFARVVNRSHGLNIFRNGRVVSSIRATESNYFRRYPGAPAVEITMSDGLPSSLDADRAYIFARGLPDEAVAMDARGYRLSREWSVGTPGTRIALYTKS